MTTIRRLLADPVYVGPRATRTLATLLLVIGAVAAVGGVGYAVNGATQAPGNVLVPVSLHVDETRSVREPVVEVAGVDLPDATRLQTVDDGLVLVDSTGVSRWTGFLARGDAALGGLAVGVCALLLAPVLTSLAAGEPFRRGNAARIGATAATILVAGTLAPLLPQVAALAVLDGHGLVAPGSPFVAGLRLELAPLAVSALVLVVAEAFRRGAQIADDAAGLV
jgi:Protein of unknown function (DUF2975)